MNWWYAMPFNRKLWLVSLLVFVVTRWLLFVFPDSWPLFEYSYVWFVRPLFVAMSLYAFARWERLGWYARLCALWFPLHVLTIWFCNEFDMEGSQFNAIYLPVFAVHVGITIFTMWKWNGGECEGEPAPYRGRQIFDCPPVVAQYSEENDRAPR